MEWSKNGTEKTTGSQLRIIAMMAPFITRPTDYPEGFVLYIWESDGQNDKDRIFGVIKLTFFFVIPIVFVACNKSELNSNRN